MEVDDDSDTLAADHLIYETGIKEKKSSSFKHVVSFSADDFCCVPPPLLNFHVSVCHDKSLFIFHTKGFLYVKCGKSG